jgi:hypothetical protein
VVLLRGAVLAAVLVTALAAGGAQAALPSDPLAGSWTYEAVNLPAAWDITTGLPRVAIAPTSLLR